jgi:hypothetical protein
VRRILVLAVSIAAVAACGAFAASAQANPMGIEFGVRGGNMVPFQVTIEPTGRVRSTSATSFIWPTRHRLSRAKVASLSALIRHAFAFGVSSRQCAGTNPDVGSDFIRATGRTVTVHGSCEPRFTKLWEALAQAVDLRAA